MTTAPSSRHRYYDTPPAEVHEPAVARASLTEDEASFDLQIEAKPRTRLTVNLLGKRYSIMPPKTALAMKLSVRAKQAEDRPELMVDAIEEWIDKAFLPADADDVRHRIYESDDDPLDIDHVMELMEKLIERQTNTPTT